MSIASSRYRVRASCLASVVLLVGFAIRPAAAESQAVDASKPFVMPGLSAGDFPPGSFSDGNHYSLDDFRGKLLVLFFYEKDCPRCRGLIPTRNTVVDQFKDKPVKFIAVGPNDSFADVMSYDLYTRISSTFTGDDLAKTADEALKTLKEDPAVKDEMEARAMYAQLYPAMSRAKPTDRAEVAQYCTGISGKYPNTPTGKKAAQLAQDLQNEDAAAPAAK